MPSDGHILEGTVYPEREQTEWEMVHWGATTHTLYTFSSIICTRQKRKIQDSQSRKGTLSSVRRNLVQDLEASRSVKQEPLIINKRSQSQNEAAENCLRRKVLSRETLEYCLLSTFSAKFNIP